MSNKVFITKYQASIDKDLPVLGQMVIHVMPLIDLQKENDTRIAGALGITVSFSTPTELEIVGDSYFTNRVNGESIGKTITVGSDETYVYFKEGTFDIVIKNKYALTYYLGAVGDNPENAYGSANKYFNIDDLNYSTDLKYIRNNYFNPFNEPNIFRNTGKTNGDISSLSNLTNLTSINFTNTSVSGDISSLSNNTELTNLSLSGTSVSGDITDIVTNLTKLAQLHIPKTVTFTKEQIKTLTDRGCTVFIA